MTAGIILDLKSRSVLELTALFFFYLTVCEERGALVLFHVLGEHLAVILDLHFVHA